MKIRRTPRTAPRPAVDRVARFALKPDRDMPRWGGRRGNGCLRLCTGNGDVAQAVATPFSGGILSRFIGFLNLPPGPPEYFLVGLLPPLVLHHSLSWWRGVLTPANMAPGASLYTSLGLPSYTSSFSTILSTQEVLVPDDAASEGILELPLSDWLPLECSEAPHWRPTLSCTDSWVAAEGGAVRVVVVQVGRYVVGRGVREAVVWAALQLSNTAAVSNTATAMPGGTGRKGSVSENTDGGGVGDRGNGSGVGCV